MVVYIYGLRHPVTHRVGYVGRSHDPQHRLGQHFSAPCSLALTAWLKQLADEGLKPELFCLAACREEAAVEEELRYIRLYERGGHPLANRAGREHPEIPSPEPVVPFFGFIPMREATRRMRISKARIRKLCQEGRVPDARKWSGEWLIPTEFADGYMRGPVGRPRRA